jgi:uncharacterized membrane protein
MDTYEIGIGRGHSKSELWAMAGWWQVEKPRPGTSSHSLLCRPRSDVLQYLARGKANAQSRS